MIVVGAGIAVAGVVGRHAGGASGFIVQVDPKPGVVVDGIEADSILLGSVLKIRADLDSDSAIIGDDISRRNVVAAYSIFT